MYEYEYHYKIDKVNEQILDLLAVRPRRLAELQHSIGTLTPFAVTNRMNKMEAMGIVKAERIPSTSTTYYLTKNKEGEVPTPPKQQRGETHDASETLY